MKMRKIAAGLAAVSMLAVFSAQAVVAADSVTVTGEKVKAAAGADFTLDVKLTGVPSAGISAAEFAITYDASAITITGVSAGDIVNTGASDKEGFDGVTVFGADFSEAGTVTVVYGVALDDSAYWVTKDGTFLTISGKVNDGTADGTYKVDIKSIDRETYQASGTLNADIYIGSLNGEGAVSSYAVTANAGAVVVGEGSEVINKRGDANCDGIVDISDVIEINKAIMGKVQLSDQGLKNADLDGNGKPEANESLTILKFLVDLVDEL